MESFKPNVLITGAGGYVGSYIRRYLYQHSIRFTSLVRNSFDSDFHDQLLLCDITSSVECKLKINLQDYTHIIHLASYNEGFEENYHEKAIDVNVKGTRNLLELYRNQRNKPVFIYFSTFHVYGVSQGEITEHIAANPKNDYSITHFFSEIYLKQLCHELGLNYIIFRLTNGYGVPFEKGINKWYLLLNDLILSAFRNKRITIKSNPAIKRDFISLNYVAKIIGNLLLKRNAIPLNEIYNLSGQNTLDINQIVYLIAREYKAFSGNEIEVEYLSTDRTNTPALNVSSEKLRQYITIDEKEENLPNSIKEMFNILKQL